MGGICGIWHFDKAAAVDRGRIDAMIAHMHHRGPDSKGTFISGQVGLGAARLKVLDPEHGDQPIYNEDRSVAVVFNGEIYNYRGVRALLEDKGHRFSTATDTEVIVHAWESYGRMSLELLRGMFAFALYDHRTRELFVARDRLGIKPLYLFRDQAILAFASEIKPLFEADCSRIPRAIDPYALDEFLSLRYCIEPRTIFDKIETLPPGYCLSVKNGSCEMSRYWDLRFHAASKKALRPGQTAEKCLELLDGSTALHLASDVPIGAYLSGGVDSSAIVQLMQAHSGQPVHTFSVGYPQDARSYDETPFARFAAEVLRSSHQSLAMNAEDFRALLPLYVRHQEQPLGDASLVPFLFLSRHASRSMKVMLSGMGGDEFFFGYPEMRDAVVNLALSRLTRGTLTQRGILAAFSRGAYPPGILRGLARIAFFPPRAFMLPRYFQPAHKDLLYGEALRDAKVRHHTDQAIKAVLLQAPEGANAYQQTLYVWTKTMLASNILQGSDKASMAASIEMRVPLLDHTLVEFLANTPLNILYASGRYKYLLKRSMRHRLPAHILERKRTGFQTPEVPWLCGALRPTIEETLRQSRGVRYGYFSGKGIETLLRSFTREDPAAVRRIWLLYLFELWHKEFFGA